MYGIDRYHITDGNGSPYEEFKLPESRSVPIFTAELCSWTRFSLAEILVLACTAGANGMAPPTITRISARMKRVLGHSSAVNMFSLGRAFRVVSARDVH